MKRTRNILLTIVMILALLLFSLYDAFFAAPRNYRVRHETIAAETIPESMDGMNIIFFSDLDYGTFMDQTRMTKLVDKINQYAPDIVIFGGDLFDTGVTPDDTSTAQVQQLLTDIDAPYGKFAVYGDFDHESEDKLNAVSSILTQGGFEVLDNRSVSLHHKSISSISLVGIDSGVNGSQDITAAYSSVSHTNYVITVCHTPDTADYVPADLTNLFLAGHSHGGQIYWLFGAYYTPAGAEQYFRGKSEVSNSFILDITNGVGTTGKDVRFLANAEIVSYKLKCTKKSEPTSQPTSESTSGNETSASASPQATAAASESAQASSSASAAAQ